MFLLKTINFIFFQGVRGGVGVVPGDPTKSNLDNIVGSLWQARQESSGSSVGNQVRSPKYFSLVLL